MSEMKDTEFAKRVDNDEVPQDEPHPDLHYLSPTLYVLNMIELG